MLCNGCHISQISFSPIQLSTMGAKGTIVFTRTNSLTQLLENDNDRGDFGKIEISPYIDIEALGENIYESKSKLSVLSLNIQSINAKFDKFKIAIDQLNSKQPIGYEPADLTVHPPPPKRSRVGSFFSHRCLVPPKIFPQRKSGFCRRYSH